MNRYRQRFFTKKEQFEQKYIVNEQTGCWEWTAAISKQGYGRFNHTAAHRYSYKMYVGEIPDGLFVCHHCDNKKCVNPDHFFLGTTTDNIRDAMKKGILPTAIHPSAAHYNNGCRCDGCKKAASEKGKVSYLKHREKRLKKHKEYFLNNKEKVLERAKKYRENNRQKGREYQKWYYQNITKLRQSQ